MDNKLPDWSYWRCMPKVEPWEACALALNIAPETLAISNDGMGYLGSEINTFRGFSSDKAADRFSELRRLLNANQFEIQHFRENFALGVRLDEFAAWCIHLGFEIPPELAALAKATPQSAPTPKVKAATDTTTPGDSWIDKALTITNRLALERYARGEREITARNISNAVATELAKDQTTHGVRGERSAGNIRNEALKGWKFTR